MEFGSDSTKNAIWILESLEDHITFQFTNHVELSFQVTRTGICIGDGMKWNGME
jgi:hypothetical protein